MCIGQFVDVLTAPRSAMLCDVLSGTADTTTVATAITAVAATPPPLAPAVDSTAIPTAAALTVAVAVVDMKCI